MIRAGQLRIPLQFCKATESKLANGETTITPEYIFTRRAEVLDSGTDVGIASDGRDVQDVKRVRLRYSKQITEDLLVIHQGRIYEITLLDNVRDRNIEMLATLVSYRT